MEIRAMVDDNGEVYYNAKDMYNALRKEARNLVCVDNNLIWFVKRFIWKLISGEEVYDGIRSRHGTSSTG